MKQQFEEEFLEAYEPKSNGAFAWLIIPVAVLALLLAVLFGAASCNTTKRAVKTLKAHPIDAAKYCAVKFPPKEKTTIKTVYKPGKVTKVPGETVYVEYDCDSAIAAENLLYAKHISGRKATIRIPVPVYERVDTNSIVMDIERENVAMQAVLNYKIDSLNTLLIKKGELLTSKDKKIATLHKSAIHGWMAFSLLAAIVAAFLWLMKKGLIR
jgi:hypothetical protein